MLAIGMMSVLAALFVAAMALGLVSMPNPTVQKRARDLVPEEPTVRSTRASVMQINRLPRGWVGRLTPQVLVAKIERNLVLAGRPADWTLDRVIVAKPIGAAFGVAFFLLLAAQGNLLLTVLGLGFAVLAYFVPDLLISNRATKRQQQIQRELPDLLDQIVISIEAGVGFEAALARAASRNEGPLAEEFSRSGQDMTLGLSRREAYLALADRTSVEELRLFARAIVQAEEFGVSVASVVRSQAVEMRISRRARAEAKAQQVPVKILLPLMTCILPVLFVIVLGPAVVSAYAQT